MDAALKTLEFLDNPAAKGNYLSVDVSLPAILESWQCSLFSFEWLNKDGAVKALDDLPVIQREQRLEIELLLNDRKPLIKPVLGIGLMNTVEIGSGKAVLLTLAAHNLASLPAHIPASNRDEFKKFLI